MLRPSEASRVSEVKFRVTRRVGSDNFQPVRADPDRGADRRQRDLAEQRLITGNHTIEHELVGTLLQQGQATENRADRVKRRGDDPGIEVIEEMVAAETIEPDFGAAMAAENGGVMTHHCVVRRR